MKRVIFLISVISLIFGISIFISGCAQKVRQEEILARFDNQFVKADELQKEISELPEWKQDKYKDQAGREEYLTLMAESRMLLQVAKANKLEKDPEIVKQTNEYRDQLMLKELVKREVDDKIKVSDQDLEKYYAEHKADYVEPEKVTVTEITTKEEAKANEVMEKIKGGADFTALAKEMDAKGESFGPGQGNEGKTRPFTRDSYSTAKKFVETAFSLEVGKISDIIVQPLGKDTYYMVIRADEHKQPRQQELSEVKDDVKRSVEEAAKKARMDEWLKTLKSERLLFAIKPEIQNDLDNGTMSEGLKQEFKNNKISLSKNAAVSVKEKNSRWRVVDGEKVYTVRKENDKLNTYTEDKFALYFERIPKPAEPKKEEEKAKAEEQKGEVQKEGATEEKKPGTQEEKPAPDETKKEEGR